MLFLVGGVLLAAEYVRLSVTDVLALVWCWLLDLAVCPLFLVVVRDALFFFPSVGSRRWVQ